MNAGPRTTPPSVVVNGERYIPESLVTMALAGIYNEGPRQAIVVAEACDKLLDTSGRLLGEVRTAAAEARRAS